MKKKKLLLILTIILIFAAIPSAGFADIVEIDPFTGEYISGDLSQVDNITISYDCIYNRTNDLYRYTLSAGAAELQSNIAKGMITQNAVRILIPSGATPYLYLDGIKLEDVDYENITGIGAYSLELHFDGQTYSNIFNFTIIGPYCGTLESFTIPSGFQYTSVYMNGMPGNYGGAVVDLTEEGEYSIGFKCEASGVQYSIKTVVDHTAPTLLLADVNEKNVARSAVDISDLEEGVSLDVYLNDKLQKNVGTQLTGTGNYILILTDLAGNTTNYSFQIQMYFDLNSWIVIFLVLLSIVGVSVYILFSRKHLRVR